MTLIRIVALKNCPLVPQYRATSSHARTTRPPLPSPFARPAPLENSPFVSIAQRQAHSDNEARVAGIAAAEG